MALNTGLNSSLGMVRTRMGPNRRGGVMGGCLIALAVVAVLVIAGVVIVAMNWRGWVAGGMQSGLTAVVQNAPIDEAEKAEVQVEIDRFVQLFRDKQMSMEQFGMIFEELSTSPLIPAGLAMGLSEAWVMQSGLTDEEKAAGRIQVARLAQGLVDETITQSELVEIVEPIKAKATEPNPVVINLGDTTLRLKQGDNCTDEQIRALLTNVQIAADDAGVADTPPEIDLSEEFRLVIDRAMGIETDDAPELPDAEEPDAPDASAVPEEDGP